MKVLIYGAGAVGLGVASCLLEGGAQVCFVARKQTATELADRGFRRSGIFGETFHAPGTFAVAESLNPFLASSFDCVLICTKSFDTESAGKDLSPLACRTTPSPAFVLFQNGWGNRETFAGFIDAERIYNARVITGFARSEPTQVNITVHADDIHIGHFAGTSEPVISELCNTITRGGVPCSGTKDIVADLWSKMLYNCSLNSLGAIFSMSYGELADNSYTRDLLDRIIEECFFIMTESGFHTHWETAESFRKVFYNSMVQATRDHYPSTLQDIEAKKKTEIDALNGAVIQLAESRSLDAPYNRSVYNMVKIRESRR